MGHSEIAIAARDNKGRIFPPSLFLFNSRIFKVHVFLSFATESLEDCVGRYKLPPCLLSYLGPKRVLSSARRVNLNFGPCFRPRAERRLAENRPSGKLLPTAW